MSEKIESVTCEHCRHGANVPVAVTFLGFRKFTCPSCGASNALPLTSAYRTIYLVVLALMIFVFVYLFKQGQGSMPSFIGIAVIIALVRDFFLRRRLAA